MPSVLDHYQTDIQNNMLAKYQYMLSVPTSAMSGNKISSLFSLLEYSLGAKTENEDAEEFSAYSLNITPKTFKSEEVTLYGVKPDSKYVKINLKDEKQIYRQIVRSQPMCIFLLPMQINFPCSREI